MKNTESFAHKLIKGRIAENIFEQMFREAKIYTILSFGYESVLPELAQKQHDIQIEETMETIRHAPDFVVINNESHDVALIEVKYIMHPYETGILETAQKIYKSWKPAYLFIATPKGFFFDKVSKIIENRGVISSLSKERISADVQNKYLLLLNEFIQPTPKTSNS